ncbi:hypothetical protein HK099_005566 [Clydaea vesicula]|uniref:26S proteasome regulatory subunit RPN10 n=1 Tax=Clydaea vesicula TaxID=447962 RepID=A0AAD5U6C7_9FUNG|nr:hypothetical protein HK099_005566 [Clydaea vesicula]KAJ3383510.1 hypothetical protein HDU92_004090 [Lobulomyces angularis]
MVLEATMLVLDNSEFTRNGDYTPTRLEAQNDAATLLFNAKTQSNPENTVGLMTVAGKTPEVLVTLTSDIGKILTALHHINPHGESNFVTGINIAQLALKHRQNKNQRQRIIIFVASPIDQDKETLIKLAKKLKKNNVGIDVVNFGEEDLNTEKLESFIEAVNNSDNSHLVSIPPGPHVLSDVLISSPIIAGEDGVPSGFTSSANYEFGVDPNMDPELALALRISMEEERARQEAANGANNQSGAGDAMAVDEKVAPRSEEDEMLAQALAMSMGKEAEDTAMEDDDDIARAIAMSMQQTGQSSSTVDPSLMSNILGSLPGVDPNDPRIKNALKDAEKKKENDKK